MPGDRSRRFHLKKEEDPGPGLKRIALGRADEALEALRGAGASEDQAETVHGVRKDLKKLRSVLRASRYGLGSKVYSSQNGYYRDAGRYLSDARDAEVKIETLDSLTRDGDQLLMPAAVARWKASLISERDAAATLDREVLEESIRNVSAGRTELARARLELKLPELLDGVTREYERGREAMKKADDDPAPENFHEWRKRAKDLWYHLCLLRKSWPGFMDETVDQAHELGDLLGDYHDLAVLGEDMETRGFSGDERDAFAAAIGKRQKKLAKHAHKLGKRLYAEKPKAFRRRLRSYWKAWR